MRSSKPPEATIEAISAIPSLAISPHQRGRSPAAGSRGLSLTKTVTLTTRFVDAVVTAAMAFSLIVYAQFMILPPHFV